MIQRIKAIHGFQPTTRGQYTIAYCVDTTYEEHETIAAINSRHDQLTNIHYYDIYVNKGLHDFKRVTSINAKAIAIIHWFKEDD